MTRAATPAGRDVRRALRDRAEIALLDVRPEGRFAEGHPLFAASFPLGRLELEVFDRLPRRSAPIVVYGDGPADTTAAIQRLRATGLYRGVGPGWRPGRVGRGTVPRRQCAEQGVRGAGRGVRRDPGLDPAELSAPGGDVVVLDARRFDEYHTMSIPTATSVPGAELVLRASRARPGPRHPGRGQLRRADAEHHRRAVADQRGAAQRGGAAQRDHRLGTGRAHPGARPAAPRARGPGRAGPAGQDGGPGRGQEGRRPAHQPGGAAQPAAHRLPVRRAVARGVRGRPPARIPVGARAASWSRRPTGSPRSAAPSSCWPRTPAAGPR